MIIPGQTTPDQNLVKPIGQMAYASTIFNLLDNVIPVPFGSVEKRVDFILELINADF